PPAKHAKFIKDLMERHIDHLEMVDWNDLSWEQELARRAQENSKGESREPGGRGRGSERLQEEELELAGGARLPRRVGLSHDQRETRRSISQNPRIQTPARCHK